MLVDLETLLSDSWVKNPGFGTEKHSNYVYLAYTESIAKYRKHRENSKEVDMSIIYSAR